MRTPARKNNPRASQRAERLRREAERKAQDERDRIAVYGPVDPEPIDVGPQPEPEIQPPPVPPTSVDDQPLVVPEGELTQLATDINTRLALYDRLKTQSEDHQLTAAIHLATAKKICDATPGLTFKAWAEMHLKVRGPDGAPRQIGYDTARKLASIGAADNPKDALEEFRQSNARRNKLLRERKQHALSAPDAFTNPANVRAASRDTRTTDRQSEPGDIDAGSVDHIPEKIDPRPLLNDRLGNVVAWIHDFQVPEIQLVVTEALSILTKGPAVEVLERAGFSVLDHRQTVSGD